MHGSYDDADFQLAINGISAAIGNHDIGAAINSGNETLTNAIAQLRTDIGDITAAKLGVVTDRVKAYSSGASGQKTLTIANTEGLVSGMVVSGTGIST